MNRFVLACPREACDGRTFHLAALGQRPAEADATMHERAMYGAIVVAECARCGFIVNALWGLAAVAEPGEVATERRIAETLERSRRTE